MTRGGVHLMRSFAMATLVSVALAMLVVRGCFAGTHPGLVVLGFVAVLMNGLTAHFINQAALRTKRQDAFLVWSLAGSGLRAMALLVFMLACYIKLGQAALPVLVTVLVGYFTFMAYEILYLHRHAQGAGCAL